MNGPFKGGDESDSGLLIGAVLLAAGAGSRMGFRPKSLLELDGVPLIRRQLEALSGAGVDEVVVVVGHYADRIRQAVEGIALTLVHNLEPGASQVPSLKLGLRALSSRNGAVLVTLADLPLINAQDVSDLLGAYQRRPRGTFVVQPTVDGLPGNPVVFSRVVCDQILAGSALLGVKQWQAAHPDAVYRWVSRNHRYRIDVDCPEDIEALAAQTGHLLRWPVDLEYPPKSL